MKTLLLPNINILIRRVFHSHLHSPQREQCRRDSSRLLLYLNNSQGPELDEALVINDYYGWVATDALNYKYKKRSSQDKLKE